MPYGFSQTEWDAMPAGQKEGYVSAEAVKNKQVTGQPTTVQQQPTVQPVQKPAALIPLRDTAIQGGASVGYDSATKGVTVNGNAIDTSGLTNYGSNAPAGYKPNTYYGTQEQVDELLSPYVYNNPTSQEAQTALDNYNNWAKKPYVSSYAPQIETIVKNILARSFNYDPNNDAQYQLASKALTRNVLETMNGRGILNSTVTENQVQQGVADLLPQYQQIARQNFQDEGNMLMSQVDMLTGLDNTDYGRYKDQGAQFANALDAVMKMDESQYTKWKDAYTNRYNTQQDEIKKAEAKVEAQRTKIKDAWDRVSEIGYVDNQSSIALGVPAGTLSKEAREAKQKFDDDLKLKEAELKKQKELAAYQNNLSKQLADYKGSATSSPDKLGDSKQVQNYYQLLDIYAGNGSSGTYANNPYAAYQNLITKRQQNIDLVGDKLYNKLLADVQDMMKNQKTYGTQKFDTATTLTVDDYASAMDKLFVIDNGQGMAKSINTEGAKEYIDNLIMQGVDDQTIDSLAARYGIQ